MKGNTDVRNETHWTADACVVCLPDDLGDRARAVVRAEDPRGDLDLRRRGDRRGDHHHGPRLVPSTRRPLVGNLKYFLTEVRSHVSRISEVTTVRSASSVSYEALTNSLTSFINNRVINVSEGSATRLLLAVPEVHP